MFAGINNLNDTCLLASKLNVFSSQEELATQNSRATLADFVGQHPRKVCLAPASLFCSPCLITQFIQPHCISYSSLKPNQVPCPRQENGLINIKFVVRLVSKCPICRTATDRTRICQTHKLLHHSRAKSRQILRIQEVIHVSASEPYRNGQLQLQLPWTPRRVCTKHQRILHEGETRMQTGKRNSMDSPSRHWAAFMALALLRCASTGRAIRGIAPAPAHVRCCLIIFYII